MITSQLTEITNALKDLQRRVGDNQENTQAIRDILDSCPICELDGGLSSFYVSLRLIRGVIFFVMIDRIPC